MQVRRGNKIGHESNIVDNNEYLNEFKLFNPWVMSNGIVTWVPEVKLYTKCSIKIKDFPFDTQCCEINFYSWAHTSSQMKIQINGNKNETKNNPEKIY